MRPHTQRRRGTPTLQPLGSDSLFRCTDADIRRDALGELSRGGTARLMGAPVLVEVVQAGVLAGEGPVRADLFTFLVEAGACV